MSSLTPGYLRPFEPVTIFEDLLNFIHDMIVGLTALNDQNVLRATLQTESFFQFESDVDWASFEVNTSLGSGVVYLDDNNVANNVDTTTVRFDFYGPNAFKNAFILKSGCFVDQNSSIIATKFGVLVNFNVNYEQEVLNAGAILRNHAFMTIELNTSIKLTYDIFTFLAVNIKLIPDEGRQIDIHIP